MKCLKKWFKKRNDLTSSQLVRKLRADELIAMDIGESRNQIQRYIRLTRIIGGLLELIDKKRIALNPTVEIYYDRLQKYVPNKLVTLKEIETYLIKYEIVCMRIGISVERLEVEIE